MYKSAKSPAPSPLDSGDRVVSLDALRGFDMIWILGADELTPPRPFRRAPRLA